MRLASSAEPLTQVHDVVLLDLDGVVYVGSDAVPGARESLRAAESAGMRVAYLTNNASRRPGDVARHLRDLGMPVASDDEVVTSAQAVARLVVEEVGPGSTVLVVGGEGLRHCLDEVGLRTRSTFDDSVAAVVQGFSPDVAWRDLAEASYAVHAGTPWFASNADLTFPTAGGTAPGNGSLVQAVANATRSRPVVAGKPERALFDECIARLAPTAPLMVGDRIDTDIDGARAAGIPSLAVLTGVSTLQDLADTPPSSRPNLVGRDLGALLVPHPGVEVTADRARCGDAEAVVCGDDLVLERHGEDLHALRAVLALAWRRADDTGASPRVPTPAAVR